MRFVSALMAVALLWAPTPLLGWGQKGHRIIGEIAQHHISGRTAAEMALLLGVEDIAQASTWADEMRSNPAEFWQDIAGPYHYVTVPDGETYSDVGPPPQGDALSALDQFVATVRDRSRSPQDRALALRFIIHIVGDLHQPLHAGNGTDRGGNDVDMVWRGANTNLHAVWDTWLIESQNLSYSEHSERLERTIGPETVLQWWDADPETWVAESVAIRQTIYPGEMGPGYEWGYIYAHMPTVEERLKQGGARLAAYLDWVFAG